MSVYKGIICYYNLLRFEVYVGLYNMLFFPLLENAYVVIYCLTTYFPLCKSHGRGGGGGTQHIDLGIEVSPRILQPIQKYQLY